MTEQEIRAEMNRVIGKAQATGADTASLEFLREWFTSEDFRKRLAEYTWRINQAKAERARLEQESRERRERQEFDALMKRTGNV